MTNTKAVETDTKLAALYRELAKAEQSVEIVYERIHTAAGDKKVWQHGTRVWTQKDGQALIAICETRTDLVAALKAANTVVKGIQAQIADLNEVFNAAPWTRFFLVTNNNGHIHHTMHCSTTYPTTGWAWNPELSGQTEVEAVEALGEILCSVCFPSAPVAWTSGISKTAQLAKDERAAKKAAKAPVFIAERVSLGDYHRGPFKTQRAAELAVVDHLASVKWYDHIKEDTQGVEIVLSRLAEVGVTREVIEARVEAKHVRDTKAAEKHAKRLGL